MPARVRFEAIDRQVTTHSMKRDGYNFDGESVDLCTTYPFLPIISIHTLERTLARHGVDVVRHQGLIREAHSTLSLSSSQQNVDDVVTSVRNEAHSREQVVLRRVRAAHVTSMTVPEYERRINGS